MNKKAQRRAKNNKLKREARKQKREKTRKTTFKVEPTTVKGRKANKVVQINNGKELRPNGSIGTGKMIPNGKHGIKQTRFNRVKEGKKERNKLNRSAIPYFAKEMYIEAPKEINYRSC